MQADFRFDAYVAKVDRTELASALGESWAWHDGLRDLRPIYLTLAGDVILLDKTEAVYLLDVAYGTIERVARNGPDFQRRMQEPTFALPLLRLTLVSELHALGIRTKDGECFAIAPPPSIGGEVRADHVRPVAFRVHLAFLGQLAQGMKDLAVGQEFRVSFVAWPGDPPGGTKPLGKLVKQARDRPSLALH